MIIIELIPFKKFLSKAYIDFDESVVDVFYNLGIKVGYILASPKGDNSSFREEQFSRFEKKYNKIKDYDKSNSYDDLVYDGPKIKKHRLINYDRMELTANERGWMYAILNEAFLLGYNLGYELWYTEKLSNEQ